MTCAYTLWYLIPDATDQAAHRAFPKGNRSMAMRDVIGPMFANADCVDLYRHRGPPARLALVLVMMQIEDLCDAEAAEKVHLTETCDDEAPHLITNVETTPTTTNDVCMTDTIHTHLAERTLLPAEHLLDSGSMAADHRVTSQQPHAIDLVGPVLADTSWQARQSDGLDVSQCAIAWDAQQVICPAGHTRVRWTPGHDTQGDGQEVIAIQFHPNDCTTRFCLRTAGAQAKTGPRTMKLRPREQHVALQTARQR